MLSLVILRFGEDTVGTYCPSISTPISTPPSYSPSSKPLGGLLSVTTSGLQGRERLLESTFSTCSGNKTQDEWCDKGSRWFEGLYICDWCFDRGFWI